MTQSRTNKRRITMRKTRQEPPRECNDFRLGLIRRLLSLDSRIADQAVHELLDQECEIASLRAQVRELRGEDAARVDRPTDNIVAPVMSRDNELGAIFECSKTAIAYTLDFLAAQIPLRRSVLPTECDDYFRTRMQRTVIAEMLRRGSPP